MQFSLQLVSLAGLLLKCAMPAVAEDTYPGYEYGNYFYLGPTTGGQHITRATYTMVPPAPPSDYRQSDASNTWLSLWIGIQGNPSGRDVLEMDFVQPLLNWGPDNDKWGCSADVDHWCVAASTYTPDGQQQQPYVAIPSDATLDFEVSLNSETSKIDQKIWVNGELTSQQSDAAGTKPAVFYSGNECYNDGCGTLAGYDWANITITLNEADESFDGTLTLYNATSSGLTTSDGGVTWHAESISIQKDQLTI